MAFPSILHLTNLPAINCRFKLRKGILAGFFAAGLQNRDRAPAPHCIKEQVPLNYSWMCNRLCRGLLGFIVPKIFVSYRRKASEGVTGRIVDRLVSHYGNESIFIDIDNIPLGVDFRQRLNEVLQQCDIMIAVVGQKWAGSAKRGGASIHHENDWVRLEVESALKRNILVIPTLVDDAKMPKAAELPDSMKAFSYLNAATVAGGRDFHIHIDHLIRSIDGVLSSKLPPSQAALDNPIQPPAPSVVRRPATRRLKILAGVAVMVAPICIVGFLAIQPLMQKQDSQKHAETPGRTETPGRAESSGRAETPGHPEIPKPAETPKVAAVRPQAEISQPNATKPEQAGNSAGQQPPPAIKVRMTSSYPRILDAGEEAFVKRVRELSDSGIDIQSFSAGELVPGLQALDAVSDGTVEMGWVQQDFFHGKDPVFQLLATIPFGFDPMTHAAWRNQPDVANIIEQFLAKYTVVGVPCGSLGMNADLISRKPVQTMADLKGLRVRSGSAVGDILRRSGADVAAIAAAEIVPALQAGTLDAYTWADPKRQEKSGFHKFAPYEYYPGVMVPGTTIDLIVSAKLWGNLGFARQAAIRQACSDNLRSRNAQNIDDNKAALGELVKNGAKVAPLPEEVRRALLSAWKSIAAEKSASNPTFRQLMDLASQRSGEMTAATIR